MKLSVVIVNYNVMHFLEQCLNSVRKAVKNIESEVFVVDNNSVDGSVKMVREKFPEVNLIVNPDNRGFSKANNQAIKIAKGEYVLLLNPDTVVEDDTFEKIIKFMDAHEDAGGLGVKMVDGKGKFLPESKRGLPTPAVAFYKIFGLSKLFPKSKIFGQYHLTYLNNDEIHEVDVLSGAFMLIRKPLLDKIGGLDESYFMYGEDIDLSYRITKEGYKNYYLPKTRIIHYKGESTKKSSINYVLVFYQAMIIFAKKHFSQKNAKLFSLLINMAVYFRAFLAILRRLADKVFLKLLDAVFIFAGIYFIQSYWATSVVFKDGGNYPIEFLLIAVPAYIFIWLFSVYLSGGYDKPISLYKIFRGLLAGTIAILVFYSLLDETLRYSRAMILLGSFWAYLAMTSIRYLLHWTGFSEFKIGEVENKRYIIIGGAEEAKRVAGLLTTIETQPAFIGLVSYHDVKSQGNFIGKFEQVKEIIEIYKINEIIFCAKDVPSGSIIDKMSELKHMQVDYKIAPAESLSIIGSNSINTSGDLFALELNSIDKTANRRNKRFLDIVASITLLLSLPITIFLVKQPFYFILNIFQVLFARKTWVGYCNTTSDNTKRLPKLRTGVLNPASALHYKEIPDDTLDRLNLLYARDYKTKNDINLIFKGIRKLDNRPN